MKRKILVGFIGFALTCYPIMASATEAATENSQILFRDYAWGTPMDEIVASEINSDMISEEDYVLSNDSLIIIDSSVGGYDCYTSYVFYNNKLVSGSYSLTEEHLNNIDYYEDYLNLKEKYLEKYGEPSNEVIDWVDDRYQDQPEKMGDAIALEDVVLFNAWLDDDGNNIVFACYGEEYKIHTMIQYSAAEQPVSEDSNEGI